MDRMTTLGPEHEPRPTKRETGGNLGETRCIFSGKIVNPANTKLNARQILLRHSNDRKVYPIALVLSDIPQEVS